MNTKNLNPLEISRYITEDIRTNNGLIFEEDDDPFAQPVRQKDPNRERELQIMRKISNFADNARKAALDIRNILSSSGPFPNETGEEYFKPVYNLFYSIPHSTVTQTEKIDKALTEIKHIMSGALKNLEHEQKILKDEKMMLNIKTIRDSWKAIKEIIDFVKADSLSSASL